MDAIDKHIDKAAYFYYGIVGLIHLAYLITFLGIAVIDSSYIHSLNVAIQVFIATFLIYRFNPWRKNLTITAADTTIAFGSAILLATNLIGVELARWINPVLSGVQKTVQHYIPHRQST